MSKNVIVVNGKGIDLRRHGGVGRYTHQLCKRLRDSSSELLSGNDVFLTNLQENEQLVGIKSNGRNIFDTLSRIFFQFCPPYIYGLLQKAYLSVHRQPIESTSIASWSNLYSTTLLHELINYGTCSEIGRVSLSSKLLLAVTFIDIQDFYYPDYFSDSELKSRRMAYSFYKDRADLFFAISEFTKMTMIERLGINSSKILVTHLAADDFEIFNPSDNDIKWADSFGRYWIYPAKPWKHKNHDFMLRALSKRRNALRHSGIRILLTGGFSEKDIKRLNYLVKDNKLDDVVVLLGFLPDEMLQTLLRSAEYLIFPSLFEGFGMPILEAMTLGCPVLSSNAGSLPEVGGEAPIYFDPENEDEFVSVVDSVINGGINRFDMIQKGFKNSKRFNWDKTYSETIKGYRKILNC